MKGIEGNRSSAQQAEEKEKKDNIPFCIDILSLFPEYFISPFEVSIVNRAIKKGFIKVGLINIRDFADGKHQRVDDRPYGGGPGMVLMPKPVTQAIRTIKRPDSHMVYLSPQGNPLNAKKCRQLAEHKHLILLCGHYEGIDQRIIDLEVDEEISIGDYVLTSGCPAAALLVDAVVRFIPGVVGNPEGVKQESFEANLFEAPQYTTPVVFEGREVPAILREGNHAKIKKWQEEKAREKTQKVRPDLI